MQNPTETIAKLRRHAAGTGPEAEIAKSVLTGMGATPDENSAEFELVTDGTWHQDQLFGNICDFLGVEKFQLVNRKQVKVMRGPASLCIAAKTLFETMKNTLADLHKGSTIGFICGAFPIQNRPTDRTTTTPLTRDGMDAAALALDVGQRNNPTRQLPPKG